ncbi:hypothetical protein ACFWJV_30165 [Streptomyces rochei]|uniref:hypothetical protein n=1 Tax=Streptomyces TaxID=1883 RepID=UPI000782E239|nr:MULTISPECIES: hypothetical protein [Streptomyces]KYK12569.1 hypothetical protein AUW26_00160 [Streptomyces sp. CC71]RSS04219.1 hypothetical protein EF913_05065 [Streptomyces sp. WAC04189]GHC34270.1 hypothetical protein GCM10010308_60530 [Streptomyces vinaceusdrappus]
MRYARSIKGAVTVVVATAACHTLMSVGFASARDSASGSDDTFAGTFEFLLTMAASWALMPLLLWAGMRAMGETGNVALVIVGGLAWLGLSGYYIDDIDRAGGHIPALALAVYILLETGLAGFGLDQRG